MVETKKELTFKVIEGRNFTGYIDPTTRKLVTANKNGLFVVKESDEKAIAVLKAAADVTDVSDIVK